MSDTVKRAVRTFAQGFLGVFVLIAIPALNGLVTSVAGGGDVAIDVDVWGNILIAALAGGIIALVAFAQNAIEDRTGTDMLPK